MSLPDLAYRTQLLLAESVRQLESDAWLDDKTVVLRLASENTDYAEQNHGAQSLILARTRLLAEDNPLIAELSEDIERIETGAGIALLVLTVIVVVGGIATASAVLAGATVNIVLAWSALLGAHLLMLAFWLLGLVFAGKDSALMNNSLWGRVTRRLFSGRHRLVLVRATAALVARTRFVYWLYSLASHALWSLFFVAAGLTLTWLFALHEYRFTWETTILPATFFVRFVEILGWLPQHLGLRTPDPATVTDLVDNEAARQAWATWLLAGVVIYGLLPRIVLGALSLYRCLRARRHLTLDLEQPYYVRLRQRLDTLLRPAARVVDAATGGGENPHLAALAPAGTPGNSLIFAFELHDDVAWPPGPLPDGVVAAGRLSSPEDRDRLLQQLATQRPRRLVAACDARAGLDRGTLYFFREVARHGGQFGVLLLNQEQARPGRARNWREELIELGVAAETIFAAVPAALRWLEGEHA